MKLDFLFGGAGDGGGGGGPQARIMAFPPIPQPRSLDDASRVIRVGIITLAAFFGLFALFALLAPISGAAIANGEVTTGGGIVSIQPQTGGVIDHIFVKEGQAVKAGQPLVRLNGVRSTAAAQQAQAKRDALRATQARLVAERDGLDAVAFPADLIRRADDPAAASAMASQRAIFGRRRSVMQVDRTIASTENMSASAVRTAKARQLALLRDEIGGLRTLYRKGLATKTRLRSLERSEAELIADLAVGGGDVAKTQLQSARVANSQMMQIVTELGRVEEQLAQVDPTLRVRQYDADRDLLRAPVDGRVSGVLRLGRGSVLGGGQQVMQVVPAGRPLVIDAKISPSDIDDVRVGSRATVRFSTVNPHGQHAFDGEVVALSPAPIAADNGARFFDAQVTVNDLSALRKAGVTLQPGIPVTVNVKTHDRTLFDYLFSPLVDAMSQGFREE